MKYLRTDILEGSVKADQNLLKTFTDELSEAQAKLDGMYASARADWRMFLARVAECPEEWAPTHENFKTLIGIKGSYSPPDLGMNEEAVRKLKGKINNLRDKIDGFKPSPMTTFLRSIEDGFVTDSGLITAGIKHDGLGKYLVLAKEG